MGYVFQAEAMPEPPYVMFSIENFIKGKEKTVGGIFGEIWHGGLEKTMNFITNIKVSLDRQWGSVNEDGTWNGIIKGLLQNRTQVGIASFY